MRIETGCIQISWLIMDPTEENRGSLYTEHFADHGSYTEVNRDRLYTNLLADHVGDGSIRRE
jgi:hypothetical protein